MTGLVKGMGSVFDNDKSRAVFAIANELNESANVAKLSYDALNRNDGQLSLVGGQHCA